MVKKNAKDAPSTILLVAVYQCEDVLDEWASWIRKLNPKPSKIVFCENGSTDDTLKKCLSLKIKDVDIEVIRFWTADMRDRKIFPLEKCYDVIGHARQLLLTRARQLDPDYAIYIDSDIFLLDPTTIEALTIWKKDIIGGAYMRIFPTGLKVATLFYASDMLGEKIRRWRKLDKLVAGKILYAVHATSGGCLCLSRKIIQDRRVNFYPVPEKHSEDFGYCDTAQKLGYQVYLDGMLKIGHKQELKWRAWDEVREREEGHDYDYGTWIEDSLKEMKERKEAIREVKGK